MDRYAGFPPHFFEPADATPDSDFYRPPRLVTHIDAGAIAAVGDLYAELGLTGPVRVLDLMSSWISHFRAPPDELIALGMNAVELEQNTAATGRIVHDLNDDPRIPLPDGAVDAVVCCVSIDYLVHPVEVLADAARVLTPGGTLAVTYSDRCFPTKAVRGWLTLDDAGRGELIAELLRRTDLFGPAGIKLRTPPHSPGDPLWAVVAHTRSTH